MQWLYPLKNSFSGLYCIFLVLFIMCDRNFLFPLFHPFYQYCLPVPSSTVLLTLRLSVSFFVFPFALSVLYYQLDKIF